MKTIIIIQYRNREKHLEYFLSNSVPLLKKHMDDVKIVIVEQSEGKPFNRGKLLTVVFNEYRNKCEYIITHDVDINPKEKAIIELYNKNVDENEFMGILTSKCDTLAPIFKTRIENIFKINGFPNDIWGWGVEDKAIQNRVEYYKFEKTRNILNPNDKVGLDDMIFQLYFKSFNDVNDRDRTNEGYNYYIHYGVWKNINEEEKEKMIRFNGLDSLEYMLLEKKILEKDLVEKIIVEI